MNKLLDEHSSASTKSELDLFTVPSTQIAVRRNFWTEIQLQNPCTNDGPYEFHISPDSYMLDLSKSYIIFTCRIVKADGGVCAQTVKADGSLDGDLAVPINLLGKTIFKQIKIFLNGKLISDSGDKYAYRSLMETELNFGSGAKHTQLQASLYYEDDAKFSMENKGFKQRFDLFKNSQWVEILAPIHSDLFMQERYLINQCDLKIEIYRNNDTFCIMDANSTSSEKYKLEIKQMSLFLKKVEVNDSIGLAIESMLQNTSVKYPIRRVQLTSMHITENRRSTPLNSLFSGILPRRILVALVEATASRGSYKSSPFCFKDYGLREIRIVSGTNTVPTTPYRLNFENKQCLRAYNQMFEGLGISGEDKGNAISLKKFLNGSTFFVFELGADGTDNSQWELIKEGSTTLEIVFDKDLPKGGLECIVYAEFDSLIMLDNMRQPYTDYTV
jgi:hypothetical protein